MQPPARFVSRCWAELTTRWDTPKCSSRMPMTSSWSRNVTVCSPRRSPSFSVVYVDGIIGAGLLLTLFLYTILYCTVIVRRVPFGVGRILL